MKKESTFTSAKTDKLSSCQLNTAKARTDIWLPVHDPQGSWKIYPLSTSNNLTKKVLSLMSNA